MIGVNKNNLNIDDWALYVVIVFNDIDKLYIYISIITICIVRAMDRYDNCNQYCFIVIIRRVVLLE